MPKKIVAIVFVSLMIVSTFAFISVGFAATYTLTVDAAVEDTITQYKNSVALTPGEQDLQPIVVGMYLAATSQPGGTKKDTPNTYGTLDEGTTYDVKVPISDYKYLSVDLNWWGVIFEHWEVYDTDGTPELVWEGGVQYKAVYTGTFDGYTRLTKLIANPKYPGVAPAERPEIENNLDFKYQRAQKELLDRSDGELEPYLRFAITNPVGGGNKKIVAVYHLAWGPHTEHMYFKTVLSPDATLTEFTTYQLDAATDLIRTSDIDTMSAMSVVTSTPGFHLCYIATNMRLGWAGPQDGTGHGQALRKAQAYLLPKDDLIATLFRYIVVRTDTMVPPSLEAWYNPNVNVYNYNPVAAYNALVAGGWVYSATFGTWFHDANSNDVWDTGEPIAGDSPYGTPNDHVIQVMSPLELVAPTSFTIVGRYVDELNALEDPQGNPTPLAAERQAIDFWTIVVRAFQTREFEEYFLCWGGLDSPDFLYFVAHSALDIEWGDNAPGIHNPTLDSYLETVMFGMDHSAKQQACDDAQLLLSDLVPYITVYSRNYFSAHQYDYYGMVLVPGVGVFSWWSKVNIKGNRESTLFTTSTAQIQGNETIMHLGEHVEGRMNIAETGSAYAAEVTAVVFDGLLDYNPYTLADEPGLASSWATTGPVTMTTPNGYSMVDGMYIEFTLDDRVVEGKVRWHDGEVFNADDIIFSWEYIMDNGLTKFFGFYEDLIDVHSPSADKVVAYWNTTSQWLLYDAAGTAALFAPQVWGYIDSDGDTLTYLGDGDIEGDIPIRAWPAADHARSEFGAYPGQAAFPWLTCAFGTGPYVVHDLSEDGFHTNLFAFDLRSHETVVPTCRFWRTYGEIKEFKIQAFYHIGDISLDGLIDTLDLARMGQNFFATGTPYPTGVYTGFIQEDVTEDGTINVVDLTTAGKNFGKQGEY